MQSNSGGNVGANMDDSATLTAGTYYWQVSYSGDLNNEAAVSTCTDEQLVTAPLVDLVRVTGVLRPSRRR
jgi:hypothetical protein